MNDEDIKTIEQMTTKCKLCNEMWSEHYIPVAKIKEKIEDLKSYKGLVMYEKYNYEEIIRHLQEIVEGK